MAGYLVDDRRLCLVDYAMLANLGFAVRGDVYDLQGGNSPNLKICGLSKRSVYARPACCDMQ